MRIMHLIWFSGGTKTNTGSIGVYIYIGFSFVLISTRATHTIVESVMNNLFQM